MTEYANHEKTIAVVDDDPRVLDSLESLFASAGYSVLLFSSAEDVLLPHAIDQVDCLISDIGLPGMSGHDLKRAVQSSRLSLPVILITGRADEVGRYVSTAGYQEMFCKPFAGLHLLAAVEAVLDMRR